MTLGGPSVKEESSASMSKCSSAVPNTCDQRGCPSSEKMLQQDGDQLLFSTTWKFEVNGVHVGSAANMASFWSLMNNIPTGSSRRVLAVRVHRAVYQNSTVTHTADVVMSSATREELGETWTELVLYTVGEQNRVHSYGIVGVSIDVDRALLSVLLHRPSKRLQKSLSDDLSQVTKRGRVLWTPLSAPLRSPLSVYTDRSLGETECPPSPCMMEVSPSLTGWTQAKAINSSVRGTPLDSLSLPPSMESAEEAMNGVEMSTESSCQNRLLVSYLKYFNGALCCEDFQDLQVATQPLVHSDLMGHIAFDRNAPGAIECSDRCSSSRTTLTTGSTSITALTGENSHMDSISPSNLLADVRTPQSTDYILQECCTSQDQPATESPETIVLPYRATLPVSLSQRNYKFCSISYDKFLAELS